MSLRRQLVVIFTSAIILPVLLATGVFGCVLRYQMNTIKKTYGIELSTDLLSGVSVDLVSKLTAHVEQEIRNVIQTSPDRMAQDSFLAELNSELEGKNSAVLVSKNDELIFDGTELDDQIQIDTDRLGEYPGGSAMDGDGFSYYSAKNNIIVKQIDFKFTDREDGCVYIVTKVNQTLPEVKTILMELVICIIFVLLLLVAAVSAWAYRVIIKPVRMLGKATEKIRDGDLDFKIEVRELDEIGQLCQAFDEMRQRLKESAEMRVQIDTDNKELIRNISHDLKTPITAVKGYSEALLDGVADTPEKRNRYLKTIHNKANDMEKLIDELSYYSKIDTNRIPYEFIELNVAGYFEDCAEELRLDLESKGIQFSFEQNIDPSVVTIADPEQLKKVINNIISNSVKYMDKPEKAISMRVLDDGDFVQVEMEDNGKGIAQKDLPLIFDRFYRTDSARNSATGGSGIGLSIVKKIVEDHGGRIWATSVEKESTTIHLELRKYVTDPKKS